MKSRLLLKITGVILALVLITPLIFACSSGTSSAPSTATSIATSTSAAPPAEVFKLKIASSWAPTATATIEGNMLIDSINKKSQGRLAITMYPGEALGKAAATLDMLDNGVCDLAIIPSSVFPNIFQLYNVLQLPMLGIPSSDVVLETANEIYKKGYLSAMENYRLVAFNIPRQTKLWFKNKQVLKAEDFKGMKIRASDPVFLKPFETYGITAISMPSSEVYSAIERGILDGATQTPENVVSMKFYEVCKYGLEVPFAWAGAIISISKKSYDKLPADLQTIIDEANIDFKKEADIFYKDLDVQTEKELQAKGMQMYKLDAAEYARWQQLYDANIQAWITKTEAQGLKGKEVMDLVKSISQKYK
jgi:TRAP-type transport system periplasmic protein